MPTAVTVTHKPANRCITYATEVLRQIQQPDFDPDDLYKNPSNYPKSLEGNAERGLEMIKTPQIGEDLQGWMDIEGIEVLDPFVIYQYLEEAYGEVELVSESLEQMSDLSEQTKHDLLSDSQEIETEEQSKPETAESKNIAELQQELKSNKQKLTELRTQLKKVEERIENARRTNIFGRPQSGENERERDKLTQEIKDAKNRIAENESSIKALEE